MGLVPPRWAAVLLAVAVAIPAVVLAQAEGPDYKPIQKVECWSCHSTAAYKDYPPLQNFFAIIPPASVSSAPLQPFAYVVQVQNTWGADLQFLRPTMDLTNAPAIAFASNVPDLNYQEDGVISVEPAAPTGVHNDTKVVDVTVGLSKMDVWLTPKDSSSAAGPDLKLRIRTPTGEEILVDSGFSDGPPPGGRGQAEHFVIETRQQFNQYGYGNWTFDAEVNVVSNDPTQILNSTAPAQAYGYTLKVTASADAIEDRVLALPLGGDPVKPGQARAVEFGLIALNEPPEGEQTIRLWVDAWVHYEHEESPPNPNHENTTREFTPPIKVEPGVTLSADTATAILIPGVQNGATLSTISEIIGYAAAFLLVSSVWTGGMFGKASRRQLNTVFGTAKRRVAFHNFLSYGILLAATLHTVLFIVETAYYWTLGVIWGGLAILAMFGLGLTGAFQVQMIRKWSYSFWRWTHYGMAVAAIVFTLVHGLLDGVHFSELREPFGWKDPLDPRDIGI